jgi:hypothetical protein
MAEAGEVLPWRAGGGGGSILTSQRWCPVGEQQLEHVRDAETLLEWLEEDGTHHEWLFATAMHGRRRVADSRLDKESRRAELVVVLVGSEDDHTRRSMERRS